jgi:type II secretory pathway pseudopilin PulG
MRKQAFTLLEVLIAMGLTLLLLSFLLASYFYIERNNINWQKQEQELFGQRFLKQRLEDVFTTIPDIDQKENFFFTSDNAGLFLPGSTSLLFSFKNDIRFNSPLLSGTVLGRLYVDRRGDLTLLTLPLRKYWPEGPAPDFHREVLMSGVAMMQLDFFQTSNVKTPTEQEPPKPQWRPSSWSREWAYKPGIIKLTIIKQNAPKPLVLYFLIPEVISVIKESAP